ncbi:hypothetical protein [Xanthomonas axonopodis]|uniref:hypothetical protein n=1 Tax=Xanthomonas axonopodis TaxID=53413 RepID=UPI0011176DCF|nr:hypothetical protein [Xanthomonas axonopodis]
MKAFLLSFSALLNANHVHAVLNSSNAVDTWVSPFPFSAIVVSRLTAIELGAVFHSHFGDTLFMLVEATAWNTSGWLPPEFWEYVNSPHAAWSKNVFKLPALGDQIAR